MGLPDFTAETALYRTVASYRTAPRAVAVATRIVPAVYVSREPTVLDPYGDGDVGGDTGDRLSATCYGSCCAMCSCCANHAHPNCCRYCVKNCS